MPRKKCILSRDRIERLQTWLVAHRPCAMEDPEFFRGLLVVVGMEVRHVMDEERE